MIDNYQNNLSKNLPTIFKEKHTIIENLLEPSFTFIGYFLWGEETKVYSLQSRRKHSFS